MWVREFPDEPAPLVGPSGKGTGKAPEADSTFCRYFTFYSPCDSPLDSTPEAEAEAEAQRLLTRPLGSAC